MHEILAHDSYVPRTYLPFALPGGDSAWGCRFGGKPPEGVTPPFEPFLYLLTLQYSIEPHIEFSLFLNFSVSHKDEHFDILMQNKYQMFDAASPEGQDLVYVAVHDATGRNVDSEAPYLLPTSRLEYGEVAADEIDDQFAIYRHHKVGGLPKFHYFKSSLADPAQSLLVSGCTHLLQLSPPGPGDFAEPGVDGKVGWPDIPWPFGDFIFHLFLRIVNDKYVFYFGWA
ncbi:MAG: hypothetical protein ACAI35_04125 [Candidatus Methylacidiphilales bacterium]|nr:hypothetical protein [Candidatus Methylacidiphilales bacterium]